MSAIEYPRAYMADGGGRPLENGDAYIGEANQDPETFPVQVYWDAALTVPASQPLDVSTGYVMNGGSRADFYIAETEYSIRLRDKNGNQVDYIASVPNGLLGPDGAGEVGFSHAETYPAGTLGAKGLDYVSVKDAPFNAVGDGTTDDSAAIQLAINTGKAVFFPKPAVSYKATGLTVSTTGQTLFGDGFGSFISCETGVLFTVTAGNVTIRDLRLKGGYVAGNQAVYLNNAAQAKISGLDMREFDVFVRWDNGGFHCYMTDCHTRNVRTYGVQLDDGVGFFMARVTYDTDGSWSGGSFAEPTAFMRMRNEGNVISDCDFIHAGTGLLIDPVERNVEWCLFSNCFIADSGQAGGANAGIHIQQDSATYYVRGLFFDQVWSATNNIGVLIDGSGSADVDGIVFTDCPIHNNRNENVRVTAVGAGKITFKDCPLVGANSGGGAANNIYLDSGDITLQNCEIGMDFRWTSTPLYQIFLDSGVSSALIDGNNVNQSGSSGRISNAAAGGTVTFGRNFGLVTAAHNTSAIVIGNNSVAVNHGLSVTPKIQDVTMTPITGGWGGAGQQYWVDSVSSTQIVFRSLSAVSSNDFNFAWTATVLSN